MSSDNDSRHQEALAPKDGREVEWQLAATDLGSIRRWLEGHATIQGLRVEPNTTLALHDTYFDTADWRIYRAGFALRIRNEAQQAEVTLKSLHSASRHKADRRELSERLRTPDPGLIRETNGPVGSRVRAVVGEHTLQALFEVRTERQRFVVRKPGEAAPLGEIALDETIIARPQGEPMASTQRVEVEALTKVHAPLQMLVARLRADCALEPAGESKFELGLQSVGLRPILAPQWATMAIDRSMRIEEVALTNLRRYLAAWFLHEPGARLGDDPEQLHDLRVAGRRLGSTLRLFREYLPESLQEIRPTMQKLLRVLGEARDFDVALSELQTFSAELSEAERAGIAQLERHLTAERERARARMLSAIDSQPVQQDLERLGVALLEPAAENGIREDDFRQTDSHDDGRDGTDNHTSPGVVANVADHEASDDRAHQTATADVPENTDDIDDAGNAVDSEHADGAQSGQMAVRLAPQLIRTHYRKLRRRAATLTSRSSMEDYHAVRGRVKKLRYALETVAALYGKSADELLRALRRLQERLGIQHDADVASRRLHSLATSPPNGVPAETLFLMGRLAERHAKSAARARKQFARSYRKVRGRRWKALKARMETAAPR